MRLTRIRNLAAATVVAIACFGHSAFAQPAPVLGISGQTFTVNGAPKFLTFFAYFGAMRDTEATLRSIFQTARAYGFDGIRMFPNWWQDAGQPCHYDPYPLFLPSGALSGIVPPGGILTVAQRFKNLLDIAYQEGMLVDVSLAMEPVQGMQFPQYQAAIGTLTNLLSSASVGDGYRHVFFDLQNEYDIAGHPCTNQFTDAQIAQLAAAVRANDQLPARFPGARRLTTASRSGVGQTSNPAAPRTVGETEYQIVASAVFGTVDIVADHDFRAFQPAQVYNWWDGTGPRVANMKYWINQSVASFGQPQRPVYQQEPGPECWQGHCFTKEFPSDPAPNGWELLRAVTGAKLNGAAAWCFHNEFLFRWPSFSSVASAAEQNFVARMAGALAATPWNP